MAKRRTPRDLVTPAVLHMLMALAGQDLHGYGIKADVERRAAGRLRLGAGTLYEAIHRMEADGWIREIDEGEGGPRKVYRLTPRGRAVMEEELIRLAGIVAFARDEKLLPADSGMGASGASEAVPEEAG